jgi:hypothetical protein
MGGFAESPPSRGRGSKPARGYYGDEQSASPPLARAWIETTSTRPGARPRSSPPRGVARNISANLVELSIIGRRPAGPWIETRPRSSTGSSQGCRPSRGGVDRNVPDSLVCGAAASRLLGGGVDRNRHRKRRSTFRLSRRPEISELIRYPSLASGPLSSPFYVPIPHSLLLRINSLLAEIEFPVAVELIPCSVAQGIHFESLANC